MFGTPVPYVNGKIPGQEQAEEDAERPKPPAPPSPPLVLKTLLVHMLRALSLFEGVTPAVERSVNNSEFYVQAIVAMTGGNNAIVTDPLLEDPGTNATRVQAAWEMLSTARKIVRAGAMVPSDGAFALGALFDVLSNRVRAVAREYRASLV